MFGRKKEEKEKNGNLPNDDVTAPVAGSIEIRKFDLFADPDEFDDEQLAMHVPKQRLSPLNPKTYKALSASQEATIRKKFRMLNASEKTKTRIRPHLYANPMQHLDYRIYESLLKHTFVGALADALIKYLVGTGFKPELEVINPDKDPEKNKKLIEANQEIIDRLLEIDRQVEQGKGLDANFRQKISALIASTLLFNRGALIFIHDKKIKVGEKEYGQIPSGLIPAHAMDLGIIDIDPDSRRLLRVQWKHGFDNYVDVENMIYLWNPMTSAKFHNIWHYGTSILSPLISASKMIRQLLSDDFPAMAKTTWAGLYLLVVKPEGQTREQKKAEYEAVSNGLKPGKLGILVKDPEDTMLHNINYEPKIQEFLALFESMVKLCISTVGLPQVGFYDEAAANRATMVGKIELTLKTNIEPMRDWIGEAICKQWYQRWFELIYKDDEILKKLRIKMSWDDLHIAEWYDSLEALLELDSRQKLKDEELGEMLGLDNYANMVDPDAEAVPGGTHGKMSMTDPKTGDQMQIKHQRGNKEQ